jgi:hypothetical protein
MEIVAFPECNTVYAKDQPEYLPLPAYREEDGCVTSCWKLGLLERLRLLMTGKIYVSVLTFNQPLQPQKLTLDSPRPRKERGDGCIRLATKR